MEGSDPTRSRIPGRSVIGQSTALQSEAGMENSDHGLPREANWSSRTAQRSHLFSSGYARSISLPQALHSFSLGSRGGFSKSKRRNENETSTVDHTSNNPTSAAGSADVSAEYLRKVSDPSSSSAYAATSRSESAGITKKASRSLRSPSSPTSSATSRPSTTNRVVSDVNNRSLSLVSASFVSRPFGARPHRNVGRSETDPRLTNYLCSDTELLDGPVPVAASSSSSAATDSAYNSCEQKHAQSGLQEAYENLETLDNHNLIDGQNNYDVFYDANNPSDLDEESIVFSEAEDLGITIEDVASSFPLAPSAAQRALSNPDILWCIFNALDAMSVIPREIVLQRRKPLSLRHAQLIFGDDKEAWEAWQNSHGSTTMEAEGSGLYNCLFVNSTWYESAVRILEARIYFSDNEHFTQFTRRGVHHLSRRPRMLVLHKLNDVTQMELDLIDSCKLGEDLEWLEFYTCSGLAPTPSLLGSALQRIILPGCFRVSDRTLAHIAEKCPRLEHLDIRACEQVSDKGIKIIAKMCPQLQLLNVGRNRGGELITYKGIKHLARQTQISTLGMAGCYIDDRAIWELALNRGPKIQRLSLNSCHLLTDASIPRVLGYMPNLNVLELRGCTNITHMRPLAIYRAYREKQGQIPLIEGCEVIERRLQVAIMRLQRETSRRVLADLTTFVTDDTDELLAQ